jgi:hypothetical protein
MDDTTTGIGATFMSTAVDASGGATAAPATSLWWNIHGRVVILGALVIGYVMLPKQREIITKLAGLFAAWIVYRTGRSKGWF